MTSIFGDLSFPVLRTEEADPSPFLRDKKSTLWEFLESRPGIEAGYGIELSASRRKNGRLGKRLTHWGMLTGVMYLSAEGFVGGLKSHKEWNIVESFFFGIPTLLLLMYFFGK